jgi:hypothetical protein
MRHFFTPRRKTAVLALVAVAAAGVCALARPRPAEAALDDGATPGAVWIDFGANDVALRSQLARGPKGEFLGLAEVQAHGVGRWAQVTQQLSIPEAPAEDGLLHATGTHSFLFADGSSFTTLDEVLLIPTDTAGVYGLDGVLVITGGTGVLASATGNLSLIGNLDLLHGQVGVDTRGRIQK